MKVIRKFIELFCGKSEPKPDNYKLYKSYCGSILTEDLAKEITELYYKIRPVTVRTSEFEKRCYMQGLFNGAYKNSHIDSLTYLAYDDLFLMDYRRADSESGYEPNELGVGMCFIEPYKWGVQTSKELKLYYPDDTRVKLNLNKWER